MNLDVTVKPTALLRALADHFDRLPAVTAVHVTDPNGPPCLGDVWVGQGGHFVGRIRGKDGIERAVIVSGDAEVGDLQGQWGPYGKEINAKDDHDGRLNTKAMAEAGSEIAKKVLALELGGFKDWYIPSRQELALCFMHAREHFDTSDAYWSSTQYSSDYAWGQGFSNGSVTSWGKDDKGRVRAVRTIPL